MKLQAEHLADAFIEISVSSADLIFIYKHGYVFTDASPERKDGTHFLDSEEHGKLLYCTIVSGH